jgi:tetratricopeptide (TPR) repeat protein
MAAGPIEFFRRGVWFLQESRGVKEFPTRCISMFKRYKTKMSKPRRPLKPRRVVELVTLLLLLSGIALFSRFNSDAEPESEPTPELSEAGKEAAQLFVDSFVEGVRRPFDLDRFEESRLMGERYAVNRHLESDPDNINALNYRANLHYQLGDAEAALDDLSRAVELDPNSLEIRFRRAGLRYDLGHIHGALADLDELVRIDPDWDPEVYNCRAYYRAKLGEYAEALPDAEHSVTKKPTANNLDTLGYVFIGLERYSESVEAYSRGLAEEPEAPHMLYGRAVAYHMLGQDSLSLADLERLAQVEADYCLHWEGHSDPGAHAEGDKSTLTTLSQK